MKCLILLYKGTCSFGSIILFPKKQISEPLGKESKNSNLSLAVKKLVSFFLILFFKVSLFALEQFPYEVKVFQDHQNENRVRIETKSSNSYLPKFDLNYNPNGIVSGGNIFFKEGIEHFSFPGIANVHSQKIKADPYHVGVGSMFNKDKEIFHYSGIYQLQTVQKGDEVFTLGFGIHENKTGELFIGVGTQNPTLKLNPSKIGALFPTGSGILLESSKTGLNSYELVYQALGGAWESIVFPTPKVSLGIRKYQPLFREPNFFVSKQLNFNNKLLENYFPKEAIKSVDQHYNGLISFSQKGAISAQSLVRFYEKTDPTNFNGPFQIASGSSVEKKFDYYTRNGFHYSLHPMEDGTRGENILVKQYLNDQNGNWQLYSSIQKSNLKNGLNEIRTFSLENQGTARNYKTSDSLDLKSSIEGSWQKKSSLFNSEEHVFKKEKEAYDSSFQGLKKLGEGISKLDLVSSPSWKIQKILKGAHPYLEESAKTLEALNSSLRVARKTEFISPEDFDLYRSKKAVIKESEQALKTLGIRMEIEQKVRSSLLEASRNSELMDHTSQWHGKLVQDIDRRLLVLKETSDIFGIGGLHTSIYDFYKGMQDFYKQNFLLSNLEFSKAKMFSQLAKTTYNPAAYLFARSASLSSYFKGLAYEGEEDRKDGKRFIGQMGSFGMMLLPFSSLGERMVTAYNSNILPKRKDIVIIGFFQALEDSAKFALVGGVHRVHLSFSKESLSLTLHAAKSQMVPTLTLGALSGAEGVISQHCRDCETLKRVFSFSAFVGGLSTLRLSSAYSLKLNQLKSEQVLLSLKDRLSLGKELLQTSALTTLGRESSIYMSMAFLEKGIEYLPQTPYFKNHSFFTTQMQLTLYPAVPLLAPHLGELFLSNRFSRFTLSLKSNGTVPLELELPKVYTKEEIFKDRLTSLTKYSPIEDKSFFEQPITERQKASANFLKMLSENRMFNENNLPQFKTQINSFIEDAAWLESANKKGFSPLETASQFYLKEIQTQAISQTVDALFLAPSKEKLPLQIHLLGTGAGKTAVEMAQLLAARAKDKPLDLRTHVNSDSEGNMEMLHEITKKFYGDSLGKIGLIKQETPPEEAKKIAQDSEILFLTISKQGELHALDRKIKEENPQSETTILDQEKRTGTKIIDEIDSALYSPTHQIGKEFKQVSKDSDLGRFWSFFGETAQMAAERVSSLAQIPIKEQASILRILDKSKEAGLKLEKEEAMRLLENGVGAVWDRKGEDYAVFHEKIKIIQAGTAKDLIRQAGYTQALEHLYAKDSFTHPIQRGEKLLSHSDIDALKAGNGMAIGNTGTLTQFAKEKFSSFFGLNQDSIKKFVNGQLPTRPEGLQLIYKESLKELYHEVLKLIQPKDQQILVGTRSPEEARVIRNILVKEGALAKKELFLIGSLTPGQEILKAAKSGKYRVILGNVEQVGRGMDLTQFKGTEKFRIIGFNTIAVPEVSLIQLFGRGEGERKKSWKNGAENFILADLETLQRTVPETILEKAKDLGGWNEQTLKKLMPEIQKSSEETALGIKPELFWKKEKELEKEKFLNAYSKKTPEFFGRYAIEFQRHKKKWMGRIKESKVILEDAESSTLEELKQNSVKRVVLEADLLKQNSKDEVLALNVKPTTFKPSAFLGMTEQFYKGVDQLKEIGLLVENPLPSTWSELIADLRFHIKVISLWEGEKGAKNKILESLSKSLFFEKEGKMLKLKIIQDLFSHPQVFKNSENDSSPRTDIGFWNLSRFSQPIRISGGLKNMPLKEVVLHLRPTRSSLDSLMSLENLEIKISPEDLKKILQNLGEENSLIGITQSELMRVPDSLIRRNKKGVFNKNSLVQFSYKIASFLLNGKGRNQDPGLEKFAWELGEIIFSKALDSYLEKENPIFFNLEKRDFKANWLKHYYLLADQALNPAADIELRKSSRFSESSTNQGSKKRDQNNLWQTEAIFNSQY